MGTTRPHTPADPARAAIRTRLSRAHGHLHGVIDMIDDGRDYSEILHQVAAVRRALEKATQVIVDDLLAQAQAHAKGEARERLEDVRVAVRTLT